MNFKNKKIVITGGSTGIGLATAKAFIFAGASVLITGRDECKLKAAYEVGSQELKTLVCVGSKMADIKILEQAVAEAGSRLDVLYLKDFRQVFCIKDLLKSEMLIKFRKMLSLMVLDDSPN